MQRSCGKATSPSKKLSRKKRSEEQEDVHCLQRRIQGTIFPLSLLVVCSEPGKCKLTWWSAGEWLFWRIDWSFGEASAAVSGGSAGPSIDCTPSLSGQTPGRTDGARACHSTGRHLGVRNPAVEAWGPCHGCRVCSLTCKHVGRGALV